MKKVYNNNDNDAAAANNKFESRKKGIHSNEVLQHARGSWRATFDLMLTRYVRSIGLFLVGISYEYRHTVV